MPNLSRHLSVCGSLSAGTGYCGDPESVINAKPGGDAKLLAVRVFACTSQSAANCVKNSLMVRGLGYRQSWPRRRLPPRIAPRYRLGCGRVR
jgi:hypothetical protein